MKIITSILEAFAYFFKSLAIYALLNLSIIIAIISWAIGYGLEKLELSIEQKRETQPAKHIDYIVLKTIGWLYLIVTGFCGINWMLAPNLPWQWGMFAAPMAVGIGCFIFAQKRKRMYNETLLGDKYKTLVEIILNMHPDCRIFKNSSKIVSVGASNPAGTNKQIYHIREKGDFVVIRMEAYNLFLGSSELTWNFPQDMDQIEMDNIIKEDNRKMMEKKHIEMAKEFGL